MQSTDANSPLTAQPSGSLLPVKPSAPTSRQLMWFRAVLAVASLWWITLLVGAVAFSNPGILIAPLIRESDVVVQIRRVDALSNGYRVEQCWPNPLFREQTTCPQQTLDADVVPPEYHLLPGVSYLLPLKRDDRRWRTPRLTRERSVESTAVRVSAASVEQLRQILAELDAEASSRSH